MALFMAEMTPMVRVTTISVKARDSPPMDGFETIQGQLYLLKLHLCNSIKVVNAGLPPNPKVLYQTLVRRFRIGCEPSNPQCAVP